MPENPNKPAPDANGVVWEDVTIYDPRLIIPSVVPGARVTSTSRSANDPLSKRNPKSKHIDNPNAFDMAPIPGMTYAEFRDKMREQGYEISNAIDEVNNPSGWATGPHWHGVITAGPKIEDVTPVNTPPAATSAGARPPVYTPEQLARMDADMEAQIAAERQRDAYRGLGPKREGSNWGERVWGAFQEPVLPPEYALNPMLSGLEQLIRVTNAGTEAIKGTPLEGLAMASPLGGLEVGGAAALGRVAKGLSPAETILIQRFAREQKTVSEVNEALKEAGSQVQVTPDSFEVAKAYIRENPEAVDPEVGYPKTSDADLTDPDIGTNDRLTYDDGSPPNEFRSYTDDEARQLIERRLSQSPEAEQRYAPEITPENPSKEIVPEVDAPPVEDVVTRLQNALRTAGKATEEQKALYRKERAERFKNVAQAQQSGKGEEAYFDSLSALKGEMPKADFEGVRDQFSQKDVDELFNNITSAKTLTADGKLSAYAGLTNILQGKVPQPKQLERLREAFPEDFIQEVLKKRSFVAKSFGNIGEVWHLPKTMMSSLDLSAPLRQGIGLSSRSEYWKSLGSMFKYAASQKNFDELAMSIKTHPNYAKAEEAGLGITNVGGKGVSEEAFQSHLGEKIPVIKHLVRGSERAYVGFLDKLRFDTFNSMLEGGKRLGINFDEEPSAAKGVANFINVMTGRGGLGKLEPAANALNAAFFSPRLISSRLQMLSAPVQGMAGKGMIAELPAGLRAEAAKSYAAMIGAYTSAVGLAALAGYDIVSDPRSSDFGKIRDGNTRVDLGAGLLQYITAGSRAIMRQSTSVSSGSTRELTKRGDTPLDTDIKFVMNKMHPTLTLILDQQRGTNAVGEPFQPGMPGAGDKLAEGDVLSAGEIALKNAFIQRLVPMGLPDIAQTLKEHPNQKGALYSALGLLGAGLQNYDASKKPGSKPTTSTNNRPISIEEVQEGPVNIPSDYNQVLDIPGVKWEEVQ